jgi:hypothetical protein
MIDSAFRRYGTPKLDQQRECLVWRNRTHDRTNLPSPPMTAVEKKITAQSALSMLKNRVK